MKKEIVIFEGIEFYKIPNVDGYYVSKCGKVYSNKRNIIMKPNIKESGYVYVNIYSHNKIKKMYIHRLVAITFLNLPVDNTLNGITKLQVNHINEDKTDNRLENLELVTARRNKLHSSINITSHNGVYKDDTRKQTLYLSQIGIKNKRIFLGRFENKEIASQIYQLAIKNVHLYNGNNKEFRELILLNFNNA